MATQRTIPLLIVEDDIGIQNQLKWSLDTFDVSLVDNHDDAVAKVRLVEPPIVLLDLGLPPDPGGASEGLRTLRSILEIAPHTKVIIITGNDDRNHAINAVSLGAYDFFSKPIEAQELVQVVDRANRLYDLERENIRLNDHNNPNLLEGVIAVCEPMVKVCRDIEKLAPSNIATLLLGESGTGKELLARALHELSTRKTESFVAINCAAIPDNLLESELFGYERGAFTGAAKQTRGRLEYAHGGTLFLDEIGDLPLPLQAKLLRFLQEKKLQRIGGRTEIEVDARIVSATHKNLQDLIKEKLFREDLYYRLGEVTVNIPPLRDRESDVHILANMLIDKYCTEMEKPDKRFSDNAKAAMLAYQWPGNIRELENKLKRATVMSEQRMIQATDLDLTDTHMETIPLNLREVRDEAERKATLNALNRADNNVSKAAKSLGVTRPTLYDIMNKHNISQPRDKSKKG